MEWTYSVDWEREELENCRWVFLSLEVLLYLIHIFPLRPVDKVSPVLPLEPEWVIEEYHVLVDVYSRPELLWNNYGPVSKLSTDPDNSR